MQRYIDGHVLRYYYGYLCGQQQQQQFSQCSFRLHNCRPLTWLVGQSASHTLWAVDELEVY